MDKLCPNPLKPYPASQNLHPRFDLQLGGDAAWEMGIVHLSMGFSLNASDKQLSSTNWIVKTRSQKFSYQEEEYTLFTAVRRIPIFQWLQENCECLVGFWFKIMLTNLDSIGGRDSGFFKIYQFPITETLS